MKKMLAFMLLFVCFSNIAQAYMYDPFRKTAKHKVPKIIVDPAMFLPLKNQLRTPPSFVAPPPSVVSAIMNNKAFINGRWYRIGERFDGSEIVTIQNQFVALKNGNLLKMIPLGIPKHLLTIKEAQ